MNTEKLIEMSKSLNEEWSVFFLELAEFRSGKIPEKRCDEKRLLGCIYALKSIEEHLSADGKDALEVLKELAMYRGLREQCDNV